MNWLHLLAGPLVGAVIGYCTNYIAVKMLFRPRRAVKLGKWQLPLTPGIIPKRKPQLAHAIGQAVGGQLFTETDVKEVVPYLEEVDMILVMCVHPGFGGQKFIPESLDKIRAIRAMLNEKNLETDIQADGGVYVENVREVLDAGANVIVAGSAVFRGDAGENTAKFMEILKSYE